MALRSARARSDQLTIKLPLLDLAGEFFAGDDAAGIDIFASLLAFAEHVQAVDDLIERSVVGQPLDARYLLQELRRRSALGGYGAVIADEIFDGHGQGGGDVRQQ